jgi:hypothetical protein
MRIAIHGAALAAALALGGAAAGCVSANKAGSVGEDCYPNASCNVGLTCQAGKCVAGSGTLTGGSGGQNTGGATGGTGGHGGAGGQTATTSTSTSAGTGGTSGTTTSSTTTSSGSTGSSAGAGPVILVLGSNVPSITQGESVTVSAVVTDPDGIDDVIGGILSDANGGIYGAFATTGQEGAYEMVVSWGQIQQVGSIDFAQGGSAQRTFTAEFFDQAGHTVQKPITVTLGCKGNGACAGVCLDMTQDANNCGTCGHTCPAGPCYKSQCAAFSNCLGHVTSCNAGCASIGKTCADKCPASGGVSFTAAACGGTPTQVACAASLGATTSAACCCF